jgi:hypothetical protein
MPDAPEHVGMSAQKFHQKRQKQIFFTSAHNSN